MKPEQHLWSEEEIATINPEFRGMVRDLEAAKRKAIANPGKIVKHCAGSYLVVLNGELLSIDMQQERPGAAKWLVKEYGNKWYGDPVMTFGEIANWVRNSAKEN